MRVGMNCVFCGNVHFVDVNEDAYRLWVDGALIQDAMPELSATEREQLISRICPKCQEDIFDEDEDEEYFDYEYCENMPCDNTGFCSGSSCPNWFQCNS